MAKTVVASLTRLLPDGGLNPLYLRGYIINHKTVGLGIVVGYYFGNDHVTPRFKVFKIKCSNQFELEIISKETDWNEVACTVISNACLERRPRVEYKFSRETYKKLKKYCDIV